MSGNDWANSLPPEVKQRDYHHCDPAKLGVKPPIPFKPEEKEAATEKEKNAYFQVLMQGGEKLTYSKFNGGTAEEGVQHCILINTLCSKLGYIKDLHTSDEAYTKAMHALTDSSEYKVVKTGGRKKQVAKKGKEAEYEQAKKDIATHSKDLADTVDSMTGLFGRSLGDTLSGEWETILEDVFNPDAKDFVDKGGVLTPGRRPKDQDGFEAARREWLLNSFKSNASEKQRQYMTNIIKLPKRGVGVKQFINRFEQLNSYLEYLPTSKDIEGSPDDMERGDKPIHEQMMCEILLNAMPPGLASSYWAKRGLEHVEISVKELTKDLMSLEPQYIRMMAILDQARAKKAVKNGAKMDSMDEPIPKKRSKDKAEEKSKDSSGDGKRRKKLCQNCARFSPQIQHTHNTKDCRKWDAQGNSLTKSNTGKSFKSSNAHSKSAEDVAEMKECFLQLRKEMKKLKMKGKRSKKSKRSRYDTSSDEDSDSDA